jgi:hypothetical protein
MQCTAYLTRPHCAFLAGAGFGGGGSFRERDGSRDEFKRDRGFDDGPSRADTTDNWGANRQFVPSSSRGGFEDRPRGGFGDRDRERGECAPAGKACIGRGELGSKERWELFARLAAWVKHSSSAGG